MEGFIVKVFIHVPIKLMKIFSLKLNVLLISKLTTISEVYLQSLICLTDTQYKLRP